MMSHEPKRPRSCHVIAYCIIMMSYHTSLRQNRLKVGIDKRKLAKSQDAVGMRSPERLLEKPKFEPGYINGFLSLKIHFLIFLFRLTSVLCRAVVLNC